MPIIPSTHSTDNINEAGIDEAAGKSCLVNVSANLIISPKDEAKRFDEILATTGWGGVGGVGILLET